MKLDYDFAFYLTLATLVTGVVYLLDVLVFAKKRASAMAASGVAVAVDAPASEQSAPQESQERPAEPKWIEMCKSFFPILLVVLLVRSFVAEPFRIPSGSMIPTLEVGDFLVVSKYNYGLRVPILNQKIIPTGTPQRGDVVVFRYPEEPKIDFIKRVIGIPGDVVESIGNQLYLNGVALATANQALASYQSEDGRSFPVVTMDETLDGKTHKIQRDTVGGIVGDWRARVPEGHYFVLGDNRDHSKDSRFWGFVPDENLIGKAQFIWMHWGLHGLKRIGSRIH